jgi:hypothetical protein
MAERGRPLRVDRREASLGATPIKGDIAMTETANPATESLKKEQQEQRETERKLGKEGMLEKALKDTFPASDPVATQTPVTPGAKDEDR